MTTRESIAKAIFNEMAKDSMGAKKPYWETAPKEVKDYCLRLTDAALDAMETPSEAMIEAGNQYDCAPLAGEVWEVMMAELREPLMQSKVEQG